MKKILLTLFAVAAIFVACDKDGLDQEITNINVLEQAEEINASVEVSSDIDLEALTARLVRLSENSKQYPKKDRSTARTAGGYIVIAGIVDGNNYYEYLFSDDIPYCDLPSGILELFLVPNGTTLDIKIGSETAPTINNIDVDLTGLFTLTLSEGLKVDLTTLDVELVDGSGAPSFTFAGGDAKDFTCAGWEFDDASGMWSHPDFGSYRITAAPFPLSGLLATVVSVESGVQSAHYAASGSMTDAANALHALNARIQADFDGTND